MYAIYGNIYHQYASNVTIYAIHGSYGLYHIPHEKFAACPVLAHQDLGNHRLHRVHRPPSNAMAAETRVKLQQEINMLKRHFDIILSTSGKCPFYIIL